MACGFSRVAGPAHRPTGVCLAGVCVCANMCVQAGDWDAAHRVVVTAVAPEALVTGQHAYLEKVLSPMEPHAAAIANWRAAGAVYLKSAGVVPRPEPQACVLTVPPLPMQLRAPGASAGPRGDGARA